MSYQIRWIETPKLHGRNLESVHYDGSIDFQSLEIGDMCYYHYQGVPCKDKKHLVQLHLTTYYFKHNAGRPPLILALPDTSTKRPLYFLVDGQCYSSRCQTCQKLSYKCKCEKCNPRGYYDGWTVLGAPPLITVQPSVNYDDNEAGIKHYHGFIRNGVIGDG